GGAHALPVGHHGTVDARGDGSEPRRPAIEQRVLGAGAAGLGEKVRAEADQPARWHAIFDPDAAAADVVHARHHPPPHAEELGHDPDVVLWHVDQQLLHRLLDAAVPVAQHDGGLRHLELEAFASHGLDQHRELELAPPDDPEGVHGVRFLDADADVAPALREQPLAPLAGCDAAPAATRPRARVDAEDHRDGRLVDADRRQRRGPLAIRDGVADRDVLDPGDRDDVAGEGLLEVDALQTPPAVDAGDLAGRLAAVGAAEHVLRA